MNLTGWSFEGYTIFLVAILVGPAALYFIWETLRDIEVSDLRLKIDNQLDSTGNKIDGLIDDYTESVQEKLDIINQFASAVSISVISKEWARKDIGERVKHIIETLRHFTSEKVKEVEKLQQKLNKFKNDYVIGIDDIAQALGVKTNLDTWRDKSIAEKFKFMVRKAKKLRREAGYDN